MAVADLGFPRGLSSHHLWSNYAMAVADLGFPRGGGANTTKVDVKNYYLAIFFPKTAWNLNNLDPEGVRVPGAPPTSANARCCSRQARYKHAFMGHHSITLLTWMWRDRSTIIQEEEHINVLPLLHNEAFTTQSHCWGQMWFTIALAHAITSVAIASQQPDYCLKDNWRITSILSQQCTF